MAGCGGRRAPSRRSSLKDNEVQYVICWSGRVVGDPAFGLNFAGGMADLVVHRHRQGLQA